jgi:hypothetical protein
MSLAHRRINDGGNMMSHAGDRLVYDADSHVVEPLGQRFYADNFMDLMDDSLVLA